MKNNRRDTILTGLGISFAIIALFGQLILWLFFLDRTSNTPHRCVFDILTPEEIVEIFFEVKEAALNNPEDKPEAEIFPNLSSNTRNFLRFYEDDIPRNAQTFEFINADAAIHYLYPTSEHRIIGFFCRPPNQGYDVNQHYKYARLGEALKFFLGEPSMRGRVATTNQEVSSWLIDDGRILLGLDRPHQSSISMLFSTRRYEPALLPLN